MILNVVIILHALPTRSIDLRETLVRYVFNPL